MSRKYRFESESAAVVAIALPFDAAAFDNDFLPSVSGAAIIFTRDLISEAEQKCRSLISLVTRILNDTFAIERGRIAIDRLIDIAQMCRYAANRLQEEGRRFEAAADKLYAELNRLL